MNELQQTQKFQRLIRPSMSQLDVVALYKTLIAEEAQELAEARTTGNILKEAGDLIVVAVGIINALGASASDVLERVNVSNMSKMCLNESECIETEAAFLAMGIKTYTIHQDDCFGVYSAHDQVSISGKVFPADKLLKATNYAAVNEDELAKLAVVEL